MGSEGAKELIARGHQVKAIALPPLPQGAILPPEMEITYGNYLEMTDDEVRAMFDGCEGFVFAAGVDERVEGPAPIYDLFKKYNKIRLGWLSFHGHFSDCDRTVGMAMKLENFIF